MKLPRDVSGAALVKALRRLGYEPTRQRGSHIRVTTQRLSTSIFDWETAGGIVL